MRLHKDMKNMSPAAVDKSMTPPKGSVNEGAVRKGVAPTPKTLGPRNA
jgi:hypothetical protein